MYRDQVEIWLLETSRLQTSPSSVVLRTEETGLYGLASWKEVTIVKDKKYL